MIPALIDQAAEHMREAREFAATEDEPGVPNYISFRHGGTEVGSLICSEVPISILLRATIPLAVTLLGADQVLVGIDSYAKELSSGDELPGSLQAQWAAGERDGIDEQFIHILASSDELRAFEQRYEVVDGSVIVEGPPREAEAEGLVPESVRWAFGSTAELPEIGPMMEGDEARPMTIGMFLAMTSVAEMGFIAPLKEGEDDITKVAGQYCASLMGESLFCAIRDIWWKKAIG